MGQIQYSEKYFDDIYEYRSKISLATIVGCMMPFMLGVCFLWPSMDCLWHKYHYCLNCKEKSLPPVFMFANQVGLDMFEITLVALQDITLDKIFDDSPCKAFSTVFLVI
ncbi:LPS-induced tumor necrosis factor alpha factor [Cucumis melo var. makuwa]|uniref:LPS-induced tumor necrosis factor alpha factor n=1 Tax=Cucumis melo var. makuwa TaxID=1194695 RepID=A0A5A7VE04_CUCMM|nr:LPS-induced tumor necrosis factor alpha factor [Cucumis melo var. makuwa]